MNVFQMPAEFSKIHGLNRLPSMLYGNCINSPSLKYFVHLIHFFHFFHLIHFQEDFTACFVLVFSFEKMESAQSTKMNRKTTTRIILLVQPWQAKRLVGASVNCSITK